MDTLSGAVERITYYNPENGYTVLRLRPDAKGAKMAKRLQVNWGYGWMKNWLAL